MHMGAADGGSALAVRRMGERAGAQGALQAIELVEGEAHGSVVVGVGQAVDEAAALGAVDELDHAVVAEQQVIGNVADGRVAVVAADRQQQLVLRGCQAGLLGPRL